MQEMLSSNNRGREYTRIAFDSDESCLWSQGDIISTADIERALFRMPEREVGVLGRDISQGIDINQIISEVSAHYIERALTESGGSKSKAAGLLGLKNYQTLNNWMEKYGVKP